MRLSNRSTFVAAIVLVLGIALASADQYSQYLTEGRGITRYEYPQGSVQYSTYLMTSDHAYTGRNDGYNPSYVFESFRMKYRWDVSSIPDNATITGATLYVSSLASSDKPNANSVTWQVKPLSGSDFFPGTVTTWTNITGATEYNHTTQPITGVEGTTTYSFPQGSSFCTAIGNSLTGNQFYIALKTSDDETWGTGQGSYHMIDVKQQGVTSQGARLVVNYTVSPTSYNITVQNDLPNNGGIIEVDYASLP